jgi:hypothetical protein
LCKVLFHVSASPARTSELLGALVRWPGDTLTVRELLAALGDRAYALLIVLFGLPNCLPMPPPIPLICGVLLVAVSLQLLAGRPVPWLPGFILDRRIRVSLLDSAMRRAMPWLARIESVCRPRMAVFQQRFALRLVGVPLLAMALGLLVAAPFIGQIPIGLGVCLIGLGMVERDGVVLLIGFAVGALGIALTAGFAYAVLRAIKLFLLA